MQNHNCSNFHDLRNLITFLEEGSITQFFFICSACIRSLRKCFRVFSLSASPLQQIDVTIQGTLVLSELTFCSVAMTTRLIRTLYCSIASKEKNDFKRSCKTLIKDLYEINQNGDDIAGIFWF